MYLLLLHEKNIKKTRLLATIYCCSYFRLKMGRNCLIHFIFKYDSVAHHASGGKESLTDSSVTMGLSSNVSQKEVLEIPIYMA